MSRNENETLHGMILHPLTSRSIESRDNNTQTSRAGQTSKCRSRSLRKSTSVWLEAMNLTPARISLSREEATQETDERKKTPSPNHTHPPRTANLNKFIRKRSASTNRKCECLTPSRQKPEQNEILFGLHFHL